MLAQKNRFHRRNHVSFVHRKGKSQRGTTISIRYLSKQDHDDYRVAVVVSKKVSKNAVVRNRIRRRMFEIVRLLDPPLRGDVDLIVSVFDASVAKEDYAEVKQQLTSLIKKAELQS